MLVTFSLFNIFSQVDKIEYVCEVTNVSPEYGSQLGGTMVTIQGDGFSTKCKDNEVTFGSTICNIASCSNSQIVCDAQNAGKVHVVTNQGVHVCKSSFHYEMFSDKQLSRRDVQSNIIDRLIGNEDIYRDILVVCTNSHNHQITSKPETIWYNFAAWGVGYAWDPTNLQVEVGDVIHWKWTTPEFVMGKQYKIEQTVSATTTEAKANGFNSDASSTPNGEYMDLMVITCT